MPPSPVALQDTVTGTEADWPYRAWATINLAALERNVRGIRMALPAGLKYIAVVKANAYGHGLEAVVRRMMLCGVDAFAVANVAEGVQLRQLGSGWPILVLGTPLPGEVPQALASGLILTVSCAQQASAFAQAAAPWARCGHRLRVHLKVDTGLGREGVWYPEALTLCRQLQADPHLHLCGLYTHFAQDENAPYTALQRQRFAQCLESLKDCASPAPQDPDWWVHADNSAGLETLDLAGPVNAVRVGGVQYGAQLYTSRLLAALCPEPVLALQARLGLIKNLPAGCPIGYGHTYQLPRDGRIGIVTLGYADGLPQALANKGHVLIRGALAPIIGRISMDQTTVDLSAIPQACLGDTVTVIGQDPTPGCAARIELATCAQWAQTLPYTLLCGLGHRVHRIYRHDSLH
jgi:alanine racemase